MSKDYAGELWELSWYEARKSSKELQQDIYTYEMIIDNRVQLWIRYNHC